MRGIKRTENYIFFWGSPLSNFDQCEFKIDFAKYNCSEQYYMAKKAAFHSDWITHAQIMRTDDPKEQKKFGRKVHGFDPSMWDLVKYEIMLRGLYGKFYQNEAYKTYLLQTDGKILVEASPFDKVWGVGLSMNDDKILDEKNWLGRNLLGKALMEVRQSIKCGANENGQFIGGFG